MAGYGGLLGNYRGSEEDYFTKNLDDLVGFHQVPQNQYVDTHTTSAGVPIIDERTQSAKDLDNVAQNQGLADITLDAVIPAGQLAAGAIRAGAGLGLNGLNYMSGLRGMASGAHINEGRREAMRLAGAGMGAGAIASAPVLNIASKGLGLGDNVIAANASGAPISIANAVAREAKMAEGLNALTMGRFGNSVDLPSVAMNKAKLAKIIDDAQVAMSKKGHVVSRHGEDGRFMPGELRNSNGDLIKISKEKDGPYGSETKNYIDESGKIVGDDYNKIGADAFHRGSRANSDFPISDPMKEALGDNLDEFYRLGGKVDGARDKMKKIQASSQAKIKRAQNSKEPVLAPKELKSEIARSNKKLDEARKMDDEIATEMYDDYDNVVGMEMVPNTKKRELIAKYENRSGNLQSQMDALSKTGKYGKAESPMQGYRTLDKEVRSAAAKSRELNKKHNITAFGKSGIKEVDDHRKLLQEMNRERRKYIKENNIPQELQ